MIRAWIGIGSNLGQPLQQVRQAVTALAALPDTQLASCSPWFGSRAVGPGEQPDYINGVAALDTRLSATALLAALQAIEAAQGRERRQRWGARTIDLDILLYGDCILNQAELTVPHPRMLERAFVLQPLLQLAPDLQLPDGRRLAALAAAVDHSGLWPLAQ